MTDLSLQQLKAEVGETPGFNQIKNCVERAYPDLEMSFVEVDGDELLRARHGGTRVFWIFDGRGEVYLPEGYRTKEGDGGPLPTDYEPEPVAPEFLQALDVLEQGRGSLTPDARTNVQLILDRRRNGWFIGDIAAYLWNLEHVERPWSDDDQVERTLAGLYRSYKDQGFSVKRSGSYEPIKTGDQLVAAGTDSVRVRGSFKCLSLEMKGRSHTHVSTARRLPYLLDTAGGCSFDFEPFRRLPLTWYVDEPGQTGDGLNFVNSHVVNIPQELSSTHFHPPKVLERGGLVQTEMYLVLDPASSGIDNKQRQAGIILYPDLRDLTKFEQIDLNPGDLVLIPPGVGHRGLDSFVNVLTIPGFKPHNEYYIDQHILDATGGASPYNEEGLARKNFERIEDYLD